MVLEGALSSSNPRPQNNPPHPHPVPSILGAKSLSESTLTQPPLETSFHSNSKQPSHKRGKIPTGGKDMGYKSAISTPIDESILIDMYHWPNDASLVDKTSSSKYSLSKSLDNLERKEARNELSNTFHGNDSSVHTLSTNPQMHHEPLSIQSKEGHEGLVSHQMHTETKSSSATSKKEPFPTISDRKFSKEPINREFSGAGTNKEFPAAASNKEFPTAATNKEFPAATKKEFTLSITKTQPSSAAFKKEFSTTATNKEFSSVAESRELSSVSTNNEFSSVSSNNEFSSISKNNMYSSTKEFSSASTKMEHLQASAESDDPLSSLSNRELSSASRNNDFSLASSTNSLLSASSKKEYLSIFSKEDHSSAKEVSSSTTLPSPSLPLLGQYQSVYEAESKRSSIFHESSQQIFSNLLEDSYHHKIHETPLTQAAPRHKGSNTTESYCYQGSIPTPSSAASGVPLYSDHGTDDTQLTEAKVIPPPVQFRSVDPPIVFEPHQQSKGPKSSPLVLPSSFLSSLIPEENDTPPPVCYATMPTSSTSTFILTELSDADQHPIFPISTVSPVPYLKPFGYDNQYGEPKNSKGYDSLPSASSALGVLTSLQKPLTMVAHSRPASPSYAQCTFPIQSHPSYPEFPHRSSGSVLDNESGRTISSHQVGVDRLKLTIHIIVKIILMCSACFQLMALHKKSDSSTGFMHACLKECLQCGLCRKIVVKVLRKF